MHHTGISINLITFSQHACDLNQKAIKTRAMFGGHLFHLRSSGKESVFECTLTLYRLINWNKTTKLIEIKHS